MKFTITDFAYSKLLYDNMASELAIYINYEHACVFCMHNYKERGPTKDLYS